MIDDKITLPKESPQEAPLITYLQVRRSDNRVCGYSTSGILNDDDEHMAIEYDGEIDDSKIYWCEYNPKARTNKLNYHEEWKEEDIKKEHIQEETAKANVMLQNLMQKQILSSVSDEEAYEMRYIYPSWQEGTEYKKGERIMYNDKFYRVLQDHTAQAQWTVDEASSLYVEIANPKEEYPLWKQPTHAENAYNIGDKVTYQGAKYISKINANTTVPGSDDRWWQKEG